jgi:[ribosomal protein S5]-alanine N-acetyltransferase
VPLLTRRLRLREFSADDLPAVRRYALDPKVLKPLLQELRGEQELSKHFAAVLAARLQRPRRAWQLAVELRATGEVIGACDLARVGHVVEFGYLLARRWWGRGYGTELASAAVDAAFRALAAQRVRALVEVGNDSSRRVLEKAGLLWVACHRRHRHGRGRWWDCHEYELDRNRWAGSTPARRA